MLKFDLKYTSATMENQELIDYVPEAITKYKIKLRLLSLNFNCLQNPITV